MPKLRKSNATFWVIFKQCGIVIKNSGLLCDSTVVPNIFRCLEKCFISSTEIEWHANCFVNSEWKWRTTCCPHTVKASVSTISKEIPFQFDKKYSVKIQSFTVMIFIEIESEDLIVISCFKFAVFVNCNHWSWFAMRAMVAPPISAQNHPEAPPIGQPLNYNK